jgi:hypothetical protein
VNRSRIVADPAPGEPAVYWACVHVDVTSAKAQGATSILNQDGIEICKDNDVLIIKDTSAESGYLPLTLSCNYYIDTPIIVVVDKFYASYAEARSNVVSVTEELSSQYFTEVSINTVPSGVEVYGEDGEDWGQTEANRYAPDGIPVHHTWSLDPWEKPRGFDYTVQLKRDGHPPVFKTVHLEYSDGFWAADDVEKKVVVDMNALENAYGGSGFDGSDSSSLFSSRLREIVADRVNHFGNIRGAGSRDSKGQVMPNSWDGTVIVPGTSLDMILHSQASAPVDDHYTYSCTFSLNRDPSSAKRDFDRLCAMVNDAVPGWWNRQLLTFDDDNTHFEMLYGPGNERYVAVNSENVFASGWVQLFGGGSTKDTPWVTELDVFDRNEPKGGP